jgi:hypothetical protein
MGIIMEKLSNSIPQFQKSITSAYETVTAGIAENVKSSGIAELDNTFETFSDSNVNSFQTLSEPAAYPGPLDSLPNDSPILQTLHDQGFRPEREIPSLFGPGWDKGSSWVNQLLKSMKFDQLNSDRSIDGKLADGAARKQAKGPVSEVVPEPPYALQRNALSDEKDPVPPYMHPGNALNRLMDAERFDKLHEDQTIDGRAVRKFDQFAEDQSIDGKLADGAARKQAKGPVSDVIPDPPVAISQEQKFMQAHWGGYTPDVDPSQIQDAFGYPDKLNDGAIDGLLADGAARKQAKGSISEFTPEPPTAIAPEPSPPPGFYSPGSALNRYFGRPLHDEIIKLGPEHKGAEPPNILEGGADPKKFYDARGANIVMPFESENVIKGRAEDALARTQAKGPVSDVTPDPPSVVPPDPKILNMPYPNDSSGDVLVASKAVFPPTNPEKMDKFGEDLTIDGKLADGAARKQAKGPVSDVVPDPPTALPPSVIPPPQQTYFQTIDQTAEQLQTNPLPETAELLQQQFSAVQEMGSAAKESVQLYQQLNSNLLFVR